MTGKQMQAKGKLNKQAGAVRQLAGRLKGDRALQAKGVAQRAKGAVQDAAGSASRKVTE
jgi:uncharacterized protein YjbJ (UPF0337 family)